MEIKIETQNLPYQSRDGRASALGVKTGSLGNGGAASLGARRLEHGGAAEARQARARRRYEMCWRVLC